MSDNELHNRLLNLTGWNVGRRTCLPPEQSRAAGFLRGLHGIGHAEKVSEAQPGITLLVAYAPTDQFITGDVSSHRHVLSHAWSDTLKNEEQGRNADCKLSYHATYHYKTRRAILTRIDESATEVLASLVMVRT